MRKNKKKLREEKGFTEALQRGDGAGTFSST
jgi:hypothetical protein